MGSQVDAAAVEKWVSAGRFESYYRAAGGDRDVACRLYEWSVRLTAASFEAMHYGEVLTRNAIDGQLRAHFHDDRVGLPWFLRPITRDKALQSRIDRDVEEVRQRLRSEDPSREVRDQIVAGLSFGFWAHLLGPKHEQLWRDALHKAFPGSSGRRADVASALFTLNKFRNRLAHHDSLLAVDVGFRFSQILDVVTWIDPAAAGWLRANERVTAVTAERPVARRDTVVVAAAEAWPLYQAVRAYVCQPGRAFQPVDYLAFYSQRVIHEEIPRITHRVDHVDWTEADVRQLRASGADRDIRIADVIEESRRRGWTEGRYQVFLLTAPGDPEHLTLRGPVPHLGHGRGSAFTQGQRYVVRDDLRRARSTDEIT